MKYFIDTEFYETGHMSPILFISIGIVAEDGREYYAENDEVDVKDLGDWLKANVVPYLYGPRKGRHVIATEIIGFIGHDPKPEFWSYYSAYDWLVFCQIFGTMLDMPKHLPIFCYDLKQKADAMGVKRHEYPQQAGQQHNARTDARWHRDIYEFLSNNPG